MLLVQVGHPALREPLDLLDLLAQAGHRVRQEQRELQGLPGRQGLVDPQELPAQLASLDPRALLDLLVPQGRLGRADLQELQGVQE